jgi:hypothetical protein
MRPSRARWEPWVVVVMVIGILAAVTFAGALLLWVLLWSRFD